MVRVLQTLLVGALLTATLASSARAQPASERPIGESNELTLADTAVELRPMLWAEQVFVGVVEQVDPTGGVAIRGENGTVRVHLARLTLPAPGHPHHEPSLDGLRRALLQHQVKALVERRPARDEPGSARIVHRGADVREALLRAGLAWFCAGPRDEPQMLSAQGEAKRQARGVWAFGATPAACPRDAG